MYKIEVVSIRVHQDAEYIGRPSPLGNPFVIEDGHTRNQVCDLYEVWFDEQIHLNNTEILYELKRLHRIGKKKGKLRLGCFCKPMYRCHGETIQKWMEENFDLLEVLVDEAQEFVPI